MMFSSPAGASDTYLPLLTIYGSLYVGFMRFHAVSAGPGETRRVQEVPGIGRNSSKKRSKAIQKPPTAARLVLWCGERYFSNRYAVPSNLNAQAERDPCDGGNEKVTVAAVTRWLHGGYGGYTENIFFACGGL